MDVNAHVAVSGQLALTRRLETIANNVANAGTAGYRAEGVAFATVVSKTAPFDTSFAHEGSSHADTRSGAFVQTGNPLDVAIQGSGFLAIETPQGVAYTRDGRMQMLPTGDIVSLNGHPILDASGAPLTADPRGGPLDIGKAEPVADFNGNGIVQGFTEGSNVNPVLEMTRLIEVQRAFEAVSSSLEQRDSALRDTIQALGARAS